MTTPRIIRLREWMADHHITYKALGEQIGLTAQGSRLLILGETMPVRHHEELVRLGFPPEMLPIPMDIPSGPIRKEPIFPGLAQGA